MKEILNCNDNVIDDELFIKKFKSCGIKITSCRIDVMNILAKSSQPMSAEQIYEKIKKNCNTNFSTVYRTLGILIKYDMITKINIMDDDKMCYDINCPEHSHYLICVDCHKMMKIDHCPLKSYEEYLNNNTGFDIIRHSLNIYGHCPQCKDHEVK